MRLVLVRHGQTLLNLARVLQPADTGTRVLVTHGLVIRTMLENHVQLPAGQHLPPRIANASVTVIEDGAAPRAVLIDFDPYSLSGA